MKKGFFRNIGTGAVLATMLVSSTPSFAQHCHHHHHHFSEETRLLTYLAANSALHEFFASISNLFLYEAGAGLGGLTVADPGVQSFISAFNGSGPGSAPASALEFANVLISVYVDELVGLNIYNQMTAFASLASGYSATALSGADTSAAIAALVGQGNLLAQALYAAAPNHIDLAQLTVIINQIVNAQVQVFQFTVSGANPAGALANNNSIHILSSEIAEIVLRGIFQSYRR